MKRSFKILLMISLFTLLTLNSIIIVDSKIEDEKTNYKKIAEEIYKNDPSNPTQMLKYLYLAEIEENPPSKLKASPTIEDSLNDERDFWIIGDFSTQSYVQKTAKMLAIGDNSYVYVLKSLITSYGESTTTSWAEGWRDEFENKIYPNDILYFGNPDGNRGDIDGDSHVTILISDFSGTQVAGYFDPRNEDVTTYSNQREMVYVDFDTTYGVLAHEFQHLIHFNYDAYEFWFVDEGCSEFAKYLNGYDVTNNLTSFARDYFAHNPDDSLIYWNYESAGGKDVRIDYGGAYLFIFYIAEKYGIDSVKNIVADTSSSAAGVEDGIYLTGVSISFNELFLNWMTAMLIDDTSFADGIYGFDNLDINIDYTLISSFPSYKTNRLHRYYGFHIAKLIGPPDYLFYDMLAPTLYNIGYSIAVHDINGWKVEQNIQSTDVTDLINGTIIDTVYIISSIMNSGTPSISYNNQFGLGYTEDLDYSFVPGSPLTFNSYSFNYETSSWDLELNNIVILDDNGTEINDTSGINVYAQFKEDYTGSIYSIITLNYSITQDWYLNMSLQSYDENDYELSIIASGLSQYGKLTLDMISVQHVLTIEKPAVVLESIVTIRVTVNATYTQLDSWGVFTSDVETIIILYDSSDSTVAAFDILYNPYTNEWESNTLDLSEFYGEFTVRVKFSYAGRTVTSEKSDQFFIEGTPPSPTTNGLPSSYLFGGIVLFALLSIPVIIKRVRRQ